MRTELGDFQTPPILIDEVLRCLGPVGRRWARVLEPTCGTGGFISALIDSSSPPREIQGFELQESRLRCARRISERSGETRVRVERANIFKLDFARDVTWRASGPLLVIGNPPWVTNSDLGALESRNLPRKQNIKKVAGIDALTGSSNFDIAESIWIKLIKELIEQRPAIALLSKTSVARNVLQFAYDNSIPVSAAWIRRIDARDHFHAAVDACLFYLELSEGAPRYEAAVYEDLKSTTPQTVLGFRGGRLVADVNAFQKRAYVDGVCPLAWRQGIKHDAARAMELRACGDGFLNKLGELADVEQHYVYPLVKGVGLFHNHVGLPSFVIVPQRRIGEDTRKLELAAPRLWRYLNRHKEMFERRKSSIYRNRPPFSIFGIGDYSFAAFKVAVSGFHKEARFRLIAPKDDRPVMVDDTSYFIACQSPEQAALVVALLNQDAALDFLGSVMFKDSKRPVTKKLLQRIDLSALLRHGKPDRLVSSANNELERLSKIGVKARLARTSDLYSILLKDGPDPVGVAGKAEGES